MGDLTNNQRAKLQRLINQTTAASNEFVRLNGLLCDFSVELYGIQPGDIDADEIIDNIQGGSGVAPGMNAGEFDRIMRAAS